MSSLKLLVALVLCASVAFGEDSKVMKAKRSGSYARAQSAYPQPSYPQSSYYPPMKAQDPKAHHAPISFEEDLVTIAIAELATEAPAVEISSIPASHVEVAPEIVVVPEAPVVVKKEDSSEEKSSEENSSEEVPAVAPATEADVVSGIVAEDSSEENSSKEVSEVAAPAVPSEEVVVSESPLDYHPPQSPLARKIR